MFNINQIEKIKDKSFGAALLSILLIIVPGSTFIYYFNKDFFVSLDILKLIILSSSFMTPLIVLNLFIVGISMISDKELDIIENERLFFGLFLSIVFSGLVLYTALFVSYYFNKSLHYAITLIFIIEIWLLIAVFVDWFFKLSKFFKKNLNSLNDKN